MQWMYIGKYPALTITGIAARDVTLTLTLTLTLITKYCRKGKLSQSECERCVMQVHYAATGGVRWRCQTTVPDGSVRWWCQMAVSDGGVRWWCQMVVSDDSVRWPCAEPNPDSLAVSDGHAYGAIHGAR